MTALELCLCLSAIRTSWGGRIIEKWTALRNYPTATFELAEHRMLGILVHVSAAKWEAELAAMSKLAGKVIYSNDVARVIVALPVSEATRAGAFFAAWVESLSAVCVGGESGARFAALLRSSTRLARSFEVPTPPPPLEAA